MKTKHIFLPMLMMGVFASPVVLPVLAPIAWAQAQDDTEPARTSLLASIGVPANAVRLRTVPDTMRDSLAKFVKASGDVAKQGDMEVLAWIGPTYSKSKSKSIFTQMKTALEKKGWSVTTTEAGDGFQLVTMLQSVPKKRGIIGLWVPAAEASILAWTELLPASSDHVGRVLTESESPDADAQALANALTRAANGGAVDEDESAVQDSTNETKAARPRAQGASATGATVIDVADSTRVLNLMKNAKPAMPSFPALAPKPGFVRGYVKDANGKPLAGARLGVRSTAVGGAYSGAQGQTDAKGYYEFAIPFGTCHFYNAGYGIEYGEGSAGLGLHPADGEADSFASNVGGVENFALLAYGVANAADAQDQPHYAANYYGGAFAISYTIGDDRPIFANDSDVPPNSTIELTLTPTSAMIDGKPGRGFVIRRKVGYISQLYVTNIPSGTYRLSAKIVGDGPMRLRETGPDSSKPFGLEPKEANGSVNLTFRPSSGGATSVPAGKGGWSSVSITLYRK